jgi:methionyl-tRNA synthetase
MKNYYITTTLPYVNAEPHIGFALEIIRADVLARYQSINGAQVFFNTGVDEHGQKIYNKAKEQGIDAQVYCDQMAAKFNLLKEALNLSYNHFIRTTDPHHEAAAAEFWRRCLASGDIYKKNYQTRYCVGCELEKTDSDLVNDRCPDHPDRELEIIDEENYFFRFSKYQQALLDFYKSQPDFVWPQTKYNEIIKFVEMGLSDFSISRLKSKMPWGVSVPDDEDQVMYVWFDALVNYISCLGWPTDNAQFSTFWPGVQICGKDNLRQQTAMWQAMLISAGLPNSRQVLVNGFITSDGQKMSKSLGNVISPIELVTKYGTDAVRYYLLAAITLSDGDFSLEKFTTKYNADLANGLGNLLGRVTTLIEKNNLSITLHPCANQALLDAYHQALASYDFSGALARLWEEVKVADEIITRTKPWTITDQAELKAVLEPISQSLYDLAHLLLPFLPTTAEKIIATLEASPIKKAEPLFTRIS